MFQYLTIFFSVASRRQRLVLSAAFLLISAACPLPAQSLRAAEKPAPADSSGESEESRRTEVLHSEAWRKMTAALDEWFSVQSIYDQKQVGAIKKRLAQRWETMSVDELKDFQEDLDAKLQMVLSPEGRSILEWVKASLAAASPAYRKTMDLHYPDVMTLTAAQLRVQLDLIEQKRSDARSQTTALEQARQARIAALQAEQRRQDEDRERALDRAAASAASAGYRSGYFPGSSVRQYPDVLNRPFFFGYGFGFW